MSYPPGVTTRTINVGDSLAVESGTDLTVRATLRSSRGLVWVASGERAVSAPEVRESAAAGEAVTFAPPVTDQAGWRDLATGSLIDVSAPGSHTHTYTIELVTLRAGRPVDIRVIGPFPLPAGDGSPVDADLLIEADTVPGLLVSVPDALTPRMNALEAEVSDLGGSIGDAVADYLTANPPSAAPDATTTVTGLVRLAGDLGGTADAPTVPGLADKADADHTHILADITDYTAPPPPPDLSGYATTSAVASALAGKADAGHGHTIGDVSGLQSALDGKQAAGNYAPALGADDNYVTDAEKAALHTHPAVIAQGATAADARTAIGAGTSSLVIGTGAGDAKAGNYEPDLSPYATKTEVNDGLAGKAASDHSHAQYLTAGDLPAPPDLAPYATKQYVNDAVGAIPEPYNDAPLAGRVTTLETATPAFAVIEHGSNANAARPVATKVEWRGSLEPVNATEYDTWIGGPA